MKVVKENKKDEQHGENLSSQPKNFMPQCPIRKSRYSKYETKNTRNTKQLFYTEQRGHFDYEGDEILIEMQRRKRIVDENIDKLSNFIDSGNKAKRYIRIEPYYKLQKEEKMSNSSLSLEDRKSVGRERVYVLV